MVTRRAVVQALAACAAARVSRAAAPQVSLTAADVHPRDYPTVAAVGWINEQLAAEFGGELTLRQYHSGQLGSEKDTLELARIGALAITRVHSSVLNNVVPATRILSLPYVFDSTDHMRRAFDGRFGAEILAACERHGLIGLALYDSGARNFYNTRHAIEAPSDLHGLKLRVPQSDIFIVWDTVSTELEQFSHVPGGANVLYLDGHAAFQRYEQTGAGPAPANKLFAHIFEISG